MFRFFLPDTPIEQRISLLHSSCSRNAGLPLRQAPANGLRRYRRVFSDAGSEEDLSGCLLERTPGREQVALRDAAEEQLRNLDEKLQQEILKDKTDHTNSSVSSSAG